MSLKHFEIVYSVKGKQSKTVLQAVNRADMIKIFKARNPDSAVIRVTETSAPLNETLEKLKNNIMDAIFKKSVKVEFLIASFRQLAVMSNAGIPIHDSVKEVGKAAADERLRSIFAKIDDDLNAGLSLTASASAFKEELGDISIAMIELGENTGNMADSLKKLSDILEEVHENRKKFKKAIRYPLTIITAMAVAFVILMTQVVPKFRDIFKQLGAEEKLPLPTKILLGIESALNNYGLYILVVGIVAFLFITRSYKTNPIFHAKCDKYMLKVYLIGKIIFYSNLNRFTLVLSELIHAGIPVVEALDTSLLTVTNTTLQDRLSLVKISVQRGISLTDSFRETELFENMLIQMIQAGEQSGTLDMMLSKVTDYFRDKFNAIIDNLSSYIEPILLAFLACMVLLMALGIFMPMWEMGSAVKGG
ncbi:MAG: type II secretion system F family protein [Campylobacteraceae bacterium]|jgi:general secretion pathway protein F/MSHA biogenesis protein MshG|nr:type II secretion system F family protein [Campylobacteraceae bacterium]